MTLKNQLAQNRQTQQRLWFAVSALSLAVVTMSFAVVRASDVRRIYIPPELRVGKVIDGKTVPEAVVYQFAVSIFQQLNRWPTDGNIDYPRNIETLRHYLTPEYREFLAQDLKSKRRSSNGGINELHHRERGVALPSGTTFVNNAVERGEDGAWVVQVALDLEENYDNVTVKAIRVRYPIRVVAYAVDWERNPWGLALDGFADPGPQRVSGPSTGGQP